jgi:cell division protein ZapE
MNFAELYQAELEKNHFQQDDNQRRVVEAMQSLAEELQSSQSWYKNLMSSKSIRGIYLWGSVGAGKTFLMDLFYQNIIISKKRFHFHQFMQTVDLKLRALQGRKDPLLIIAAEFAKECKLLFIDEFLVNDIAYAMILAELLQALYKHKIVLITTSNTEPDNLYRDGLQRARFLPAIALLKTECQVIGLQGKCDYRLEKGSNLKTYLFPLTHDTNHTLNSQFQKISKKIEDPGQIIIQNRAIPFEKKSREAIWFDFEVICKLGRSQLDYLELSDIFPTIFISNIPQLQGNEGQALLFTYLVDILYDKKTRLIVSAQVPLNELYPMNNKKFFMRTISRLEEMQSSEYLQ